MLYLQYVWRPSALEYKACHVVLFLMMERDAEWQIQC